MPLYNYLVSFSSEEHMLYMNEIARLYKIKDKNGKPHTRLIGALIRDYQEKTKIEFIEYFWKDCVHKVYPKSQYECVINNLKLDLPKLNKEDGFYCYIDSNNRNYWFSIEL